MTDPEESHESATHTTLKMLSIRNGNLDPHVQILDKLENFNTADNVVVDLRMYMSFTLNWSWIYKMFYKLRDKLKGLHETFDLLKNK